MSTARVPRGREWLCRALAALPLVCSPACSSAEGAGTATGSAGAAEHPTAASGNGGVSAGGARAFGGGGAGAAGGGANGGRANDGASGGGGASAGGAGASAGGAGAGGSGGMAGGGGARAGAGGRGVAGGGAGGRGNDAGTGGSGGASGPVSLTIFDEVPFFDGYATLVSDPVPAGVQRLRNDLLTHELTDAELAAVRSTLHVSVVIGALCDNYDRIGSVALALVPKGKTTYVPEDVARIEVGRFITPFMDKNRQPDAVSYEYGTDNLVPVLHDAALRAKYDFWLELELFGVPYSANTQVSGCADRSDVFRGSVTLRSDASAPAPVFDELLPLAYKAPFNDYQAGASDKKGTTRKTIPFELATATADTALVLITSNHGANTGGEEYSRRDHFVYVDDALELTYKPGRTSCEPFRKYNTQSNGIYGTTARSDADWQSFSNWCPGDVIDTRVIALGAMSAGRHEFVLDVPDAEFADDQGDIPLSLYLQARSQ